MATRIALTKVSKQYGPTRAVDNLSLEVERGKVVGLLGPNGAGKSTTLLMMAGLVRPSSGTVSLFGKDLQKSFTEIVSRIGVLPERPAFYDALSIRQNLKLQARLARHSGNLDRILDLTGLLPLANSRVRSLSQGMRQRLGLAQAMLTEPEVLLLDEPTAGLDPEARTDVLRLLRDLAERAGVTIVVTTHQMHEVEVLCDRVAVLRRGKLLSCSATDALLSYDTSHVEVLLEGAEGAAKRLREQPWVAEVTIKPGRLIVRLDGEPASYLNSYLVTAGYKINGIFPRRRTLQEYCMQTVYREQDESVAS